MRSLMAHPVSLSKIKLLDEARCPRKLWLAQYRPEIEEEDAELAAARESRAQAAARAREAYGRAGGLRIGHERGLRAAIAATREVLATGGEAPLFDAAFDCDGISIDVEVLDRAAGTLRIVKSTTRGAVEPDEVLDCAIQVYALETLGFTVGGAALVTVADGAAAEIVATDVTVAVAARVADVPALVARAAATLAALDEPGDAVGPQCATPERCPFFAHCRAG